MAGLMRADARAIPLADESVDLIVTSPPYFALRSYTDGGEHYDGQIGSEATPQAFLEALWAVTTECWRVLKPTGSLWVNLGDKYVNKRLAGLPWRYALGCMDGAAAPQGRLWLLRAEVIWDKPNGMPDSVKDRVRRNHETWFHLTKQSRYFSSIDAVREPHATKGGKSYQDRLKDGQVDTKAGGTRGVDAGSVTVPSLARSPLGKVPGSVWSVPFEPLKVPDHLGVDHTAPFPQEWPHKLILGWSPPGGVVLDPFGGTGTVAMVARALDRYPVHLDLSADYLRLAQWRVYESNHFEKRQERLRKKAARGAS